uniref:ThreoninetRNA ligase n=1 Tax=Rhizophora mucronata TaxID=61149 RepID=A0A2P2LKQ7_RHIMU
MSHELPLTSAINALAAKLFEISLAISIGEVIHFFPSFTVPSGKVILTQQKPQEFKIPEK